MYPTIHNFKGENLETQGYGALADCIECTVSEELNGAYTLNLTYPLNGLHSEYLVTGNIIVAQPSHNQSKQPFRIHQVKRSFANNIQVEANHISYDMSGYTLRDPRSYSSLAETIDEINQFDWSILNYYHHFTFATDMTSNKPFAQEGLNTLRAWMGGKEGSILDVYGGEWVYDKFTCFLTSRRGRDTGYRISYGKNLTEYEKQKDLTEYSNICAYWKKSDTVAYSDLISTGLDCALRVGYVDASNAYESQPTRAQLNTYAENYARTMPMGGATITVKQEQLGNDVIGLGDGVLICYETVFSTRVIKTVWNVLTERYDTLQLGSKKENISDTIRSVSGGSSGSSSGGGVTPITITVDSELSTISTNPVQNRIITNALNNKVEKESGKGLSTNDFTTTEKSKLSGIASGAEVNVQSDWNVTSTTSDAYIKNKPTIPTKTSDLTNDSNFVSDASYVHTDNNFTTTEKNKLSGIASGAEVNQNAFSNVKVGSTTIAADGETDTLELIAGDNITLTPNATNDSVTITASGSGEPSPEIYVDTADAGLCRIGKIVELRYYGKSASEIRAYTLPTGCRPAHKLSFPMVVSYNGNLYMGYLLINTNGTLETYYYNYGGAGNIPASGSIVYCTLVYFIR